MLPTSAGDVGVLVKKFAYWCDLFFQIGKVFDMGFLIQIIVGNICLLVRKNFQFGKAFDMGFLIPILVGTFGYRGELFFILVKLLTWDF